MSIQAQKIAVTGASGFIGKHVCDKLASHGFVVIPLSRNASDVAHRWSAETSLDDSASLLRDAHAVVHLAAHLPAQYEDSEQAAHCYNVNGLGTLRLLQAAQASQVRHFVHASTCALYTPSANAVDEHSPTIPQRAVAYLASKLAAEVYVAGFGATGMLSTTTLRLASVYGPGMSSSGLLPNCVRQLKASGRFTVADANRFRTDLVHVFDVADAILRVVERTAVGTFNIASGQSVAPLDLATTLARLLGVSADGIEIAPAQDRPVPGYTALDIQKASRVLGLNPRTLEDGLRSYLERSP